MYPLTDGFAYAEAVGDDGRYRGLILGTPPGPISMSGLVVDPRVADAQIQADKTAADAWRQATRRRRLIPRPGQARRGDV